LGPALRGSLSAKLAAMVKEVGGTTYLASASARLVPEVFDAAGVSLIFFRFAGANPSVIDPLFRTGELPSAPLQEVNVA
jgi:hypothetical protein